MRQVDVGLPGLGIIKEEDVSELVTLDGMKAARCQGQREAEGASAVGPGLGTCSGRPALLSTVPAHGTGTLGTSGPDAWVCGVAGTAWTLG